MAFNKNDNLNCIATHFNVSPRFFQARLRHARRRAIALRERA
jgi:hypothetical protein